MIKGRDFTRNRLTGFGLPALRRQLLSRCLGLPRPGHAVRIQRNIPIPMHDGIRLMTDHYVPSGRGPFPTVLIRSYYGRGREMGNRTGYINSFVGVRFAERGYQVLIQTTRGRFDSEGDPAPLVNEARDGHATLDWIARQPWFDGNLGMWGQSYLGYTQWAVAAKAPPFLKALCPSTTGSQFFTLTYPDGALGLGTMMRWIYLVHAIDPRDSKSPWQRLLDLRPAVFDRRFSQACSHLPFGEADEMILGFEDPYYQELLAHPNRNHPRWAAIDFSRNLSQVTPAVALLTGWYDLLLRELLADYQGLHAAGKKPSLTIGPWTHAEFPMILAALKDGLRWYDRYLKGLTDPREDLPVRVYVMGAEEWRRFPDWPPPGVLRRFFLQPDRGLATEIPPNTASQSRYRYDPADPTPVLGGPRLHSPKGRVDNHPLETRDDVLVFTSRRRSVPLEVMGPVRMDLFIRSDLAHTDFFARLCDVRPDGRSFNVCDGLVRLTPGAGMLQPDGSRRVQIDMWSTAHVFLPGHRLRVLIASGAHPRWNRNLGTGASLATGTGLRAAHQTVFHDRRRPSAIVLPVPT